jgi:hypothetical protein
MIVHRDYTIANPSKIDDAIVSFRELNTQCR